MDAPGYRRELRAHAAKLGFTGGRKDGDRIRFRHSVFKDAIEFPYVPTLTDILNYFRHCKGVLTNAHNTAIGKPPRVNKPSKKDPRWLIPSENAWDDWIFANYEPLMPPEGVAEERGGKWITFLRIHYVDEVWSRVRQATAEGRLTFAAKISTYRTMGGDGRFVLCVFTADAEDVADIMRVRDLLRAMDFKRMSYKSNAMTRALEHGSSFSA